MKMHRSIILMLTVFFIHTSLQSQVVKQAQALANETISMMGGMQNYNAIRYIGWNFFGKRQLLWDKHENVVRVDLLNKSVSIIASLENETCVLFMDGKRITHPDSLAKYHEKAMLYWMNDSYWLVMPFKLFDDGVQLTYVGKGTTTYGRTAEILELTFENVGKSPQNKYHLYIDSETRFISQWDYYNNRDDARPAIVNAWTDYAPYGKIFLASGRGGQGEITDIHVWDKLSLSVFGQVGIPEFSHIK